MFADDGVNCVEQAAGGGELGEDEESPAGLKSSHSETIIGDLFSPFLLSLKVIKNCWKKSSFNL